MISQCKCWRQTVSRFFLVNWKLLWLIIRRSIITISLLNWEHSHIDYDEYFTVPRTLLDCVLWQGVQPLLRKQVAHTIIQKKILNFTFWVMIHQKNTAKPNIRLLSLFPTFPLHMNMAQSKKLQSWAPDTPQKFHMFLTHLEFLVLLKILQICMLGHELAWLCRCDPPYQTLRTKKKIDSKFFWTQIFSIQNFWPNFLNPKFVWAQKILSLKLFGPTIVFDQNLFGPNNFFCVQKGLLHYVILATKLLYVILFHEDITQQDLKISSPWYTCDKSLHQVSTMSVHYFWRYDHFSERHFYFLWSDF